MRNYLCQYMGVIWIVIVSILLSCAPSQEKRDESDFYLNRGLAYAKKGQHDQAISGFTKAVEINPRYRQAYYRRGLAYYFKKEFGKSWDNIAKAQDLGYQVPPKLLDDLRKASVLPATLKADMPLPPTNVDRSVILEGEDYALKVRITLLLRRSR